MTTINQRQCRVADEKTITVTHDTDGSLFLAISGPDAGSGYFDSAAAAQIVKAINDEMGFTNSTPKSRPHGPQEYKGNGKHAWETVIEETPATLGIVRLRVPGGWLYGSEHDNDGSMAFVPMPTAVGYGV